MENDEIQPIDHELIERAIARCKRSQEEKYLNGLKTPATVKCVVCDVILEPSFDYEYPDEPELLEEFVKHNPFHGGGAGVFDFGYGSRHDTDVCVIAICDDCYEKKVQTGGILFCRSYMP